MDLDTTQALLRSGDPAQRQAAARDLGRHLAATAAGDWVLQFRRLAARLQRTAASEYERGFLEALELVATGFDRQVEDLRADAVELTKIQTRAHWLPALRLLARGVRRPSDLVAELEIHKSQGSRLIDELQAAGLVTQASEGKEKPCELTARARVLLEQLPAEPSPEGTPPEGTPPEATPPEAMPPEEPIAARLVPVIVHCMGTMARNRRVGRSRLLNDLQRDLGARAAPRIMDLLNASLRDHGLGIVDVDDDTVIATDIELQARLTLELALACTGRRTPLVAVLQRMSEQDRVLLHVSGTLSEWDVLVATHALTRVSVIRDADALLTPPALEPAYQVIYESPSLLADALRSGTHDAVIDRARRRFHLGVAPSPRIRDFGLIEVGPPDLVP